MSKTIILISVPAVLFGFAFSVLAIGTISTDKDFYLPGREIFYTILNPRNEGANIVLYNTETGKLYASCDNTISLTPTLKLSESCYLYPSFDKLAGLPPVGQYSLVVDTSGKCELGLEYDVCKNQNGFSSESKFSVSSTTKNGSTTPAPQTQKQVSPPGSTVQTEIGNKPVSGPQKETEGTISTSASSPVVNVPVRERRLTFFHKLVLWLISPLRQINWRQ